MDLRDRPNTTVVERLELAELYQIAADSLPSGVLVIAPDGRIALANSEVERQFGYHRDALIGQRVELLLPDGLRDVHVAHIQGFPPRSENRPVGRLRELVGLRRDGSTFPLEVALRPIETSAGHYLLAAVVDSTARRAAEEASIQAIAAQLDFERLVAEVSVQFINVPASDVDGAICDALQRIGQALSLDRCTFFRIASDGVLTDAIGWQAEGILPLPSPVQARELYPWALAQALAGETICFSSTDEIPDPVDRESHRTVGTLSAVTVPLSVGGRIAGAVGFNAVRAPRVWKDSEVHRLRVVASGFGSVVARREAEAALRGALAEVERLRDKLQAENQYLRRDADDRLGNCIVGQSRAVREALDLVRQVAATDSTVLLLGETGTGKELFATQIHELSARHGRPMVRVNCSAIPATLIESELFGREKGAFTGALARQIGRFELADHSTIFLDEIGELPLDVQVKLLRVLEERQLERLGSPKAIKVDVRIIAATHRNLEKRIEDGSFREDLFYRLNVFPIQVPPLRERVDDIPPLVWRFVDEFSKAFGKRIDAISQETMASLEQYSWPGNIRELRNVVERAMIVATGPRLTVTLPTPTPAATRRSAKLNDVEREHIRGVLESTGWRIRGTGGAADRLGLRPTTLETRLAKLGLKRPRPSN